jgi:hypothetical protein
VLEPDCRAACRRRDLLDPAAEDDLDTGGRVTAREPGGDRCRHAPAKLARQDLDHVRVGAERPGARRDLEPDEAAADDGKVDARHQPGTERLGIAQIAQHVDKTFEPRHRRQAARLATGGQQALGVGQRGAVSEARRPPPAIDRCHRRLRAEIDACRAHRLAIGEGERVDGALARQELLGQGRTLLGGRALTAEQHDRPAMARLAQSERGTPAGLARADDDHARRVPGHRSPATRRVPA